MGAQIDALGNGGAHPSLLLRIGWRGGKQFKNSRRAFINDRLLWRPEQGKAGA